MRAKLCPRPIQKSGEEAVCVATYLDKRKAYIRKSYINRACRIRVSARMMLGLRKRTCAEKSFQGQVSRVSDSFVIVRLFLIYDSYLVLSPVASDNQRGSFGN